jgi:hypothetical protein
MGSLSIWHWLIFIFFIVVLGIPLARILTRIGYSKWWTIVYFIPFVTSSVFGFWPIHAGLPLIGQEHKRMLAWRMKWPMR